MFDPAPRRAAFRALHARGCFVLPNPWDVGTARVLARLGFPALASTSAGYAFSRGLPDLEAATSRDDVLAHLAELAAATALPLNADFASGFARDEAGVAESVALCVATGVSGLSIEDATGDPARPLFDLPEAVARVRAARAAIDTEGADVVLTARAECYLVGHPDPLAESLRRLTAYAEAGADVLYAPGPRTRADIEAIVAAAAPKPVNVLMAAHAGLTVADLAAMGVRRVSLGSALARAAWTGFLRAVRPLAADGSFAGLEDLVSHAELDSGFREDRTSP